MVDVNTGLNTHTHAKHYWMLVETGSNVPCKYGYTKLVLRVMSCGLVTWQTHP